MKRGLLRRVRQQPSRIKQEDIWREEKNPGWDIRQKR